jgi:hypothetical protein
MRRAYALFAGPLIFSVSGVAWAQAKSAAQTQFDWGLAEMQAGHFETGCPALAESYKLEPLPGALFTLAECESKWGKLATALSHYSAYLDLFSRMTAQQKVDQVGRDQLARTARERLRREVPLLTITLAPSTPPGTVIRCDGDPVNEPSLGTALPLDPGTHVLVARTPEGREFEQRIVVAASERKTQAVDVITMSPIGVRVSMPSAEPPVLATIATPSPPSSNPDRSSSWGPWIWGSGALGLAGLTVGTVAGIVTWEDKSTIDSQCAMGGNPVPCSSTGKSAADSSRVSGLVSDIGFGVGLAGLATALTLWLAHPRRTQAATVRDLRAKTATDTTSPRVTWQGRTIAIRFE